MFCRMIIGIMFNFEMVIIYRQPVVLPLNIGSLEATWQTNQTVVDHHTNHTFPRHHDHIYHWGHECCLKQG